jgi:hypothetical protein
VGGEEEILGKGIGIRKYLRVVQQPHSSVYNLDEGFFVLLLRGYFTFL